MPLNHHSYSRGLLLAGVALAGLCAADAAAAAEAPVQIEELVVTAQKREQSLLDVDLTVKAAGAEELRARRVEQVKDLVGFTANVDIKENAPGSLPVVTIRGVGLNDFSATNNPSAGIYVDEVYLSSLSVMSFDLYDLERIEVLKGPQGTLYGRNSTAGAINFISAKPKLGEASGWITGDLGNYQTGQLEAVANLPIGQDLAVRVSAKTIQQDRGYWFNRVSGHDIGERNIAMGRLQVRWNPGPQADVTFKLDGLASNSEAGQGAFFGAKDFSQPPPRACAALAQGRIDPNCTDNFGYRDTDSDPFTGDWSVNPYSDIAQYASTLHGQFDLGAVKLTSVTGLLHSDRKSFVDTDAGPRAQSDFASDNKVDQFSQEARLAGDAGRLQWVAGAFVSHDHIRVYSNGYLDALFRTRSYGLADQKTDSAAAFANGEWALSDQLKLVTGLRYTWEEKSYRGGTTDLNPFGTSCLLSRTCTPGPTAPVALTNQDTKIRDTNWSWKVALDWKPDPLTLVYVSASQGVKSGGFFSGFTTANSSLAPYRPETLIAYELGVKRRTDDHQLQVNASTFYYDYSDIQTFVRDTASAIAAQRLGNVDTAKVYGLDLDAEWRPPAVSGLTLDLGVGLLHSRLGAFASSGAPVPAGNELPNAPEFSANWSVRYERPLTEALTGSVQVDGRYSDATYKDALNDPLIAAPSYSVWNARVAVQGGAWTAAVWGQNIFDELYVTSGVNLSGLGYGYRLYGAPRTWGVSLTRRF
ncbi:TonB-dependent receptor [Phenylobacterium sp.]|uniref:TonB-dependent receptor n=1 Tax=Phenylobacterium sp. TaxID=1871053 RepID=UPI0035B32D04